MGCNRVFDHVNQVFDFSYFFLKPSLVPTLGQPGLGSTRQAGLGFKTMIWILSPEKINVIDIILKSLRR